MHTLDHNSRLLDAHHERPDEPGTEEGETCIKGVKTCNVNGCFGRHKAKGYCKKHYVRYKNHGTPIGPGTEIGAPATFLSAVVANPPNQCVSWPYGKYPDGYGRIRINGMDIGAHRAALLAYAGPPPNGKPYAAHRPNICHNRSCVNPKHLRWASPKENTFDMLKDGTRIMGEKHSAAILTDRDVRLIRKDNRKQSVIADEYGVNYTTISNIKTRTTWGHIV